MIKEPEAAKVHDRLARVKEGLSPARLGVMTLTYASQFQQHGYFHPELSPFFTKDKRILSNSLPDG